MSGLDGGLATRQGAFVAACIPHILALYASFPSTPGASAPPSEVILVGHSMGGLVATLAAVSAPSGTLSLIVTLAGPHARSAESKG